MEEKTEKNILKMKLIFSLEKLLEKSDFRFTILTDNYFAQYPSDGTLLHSHFFTFSWQN